MSLRRQWPERSPGLFSWLHELPDILFATASLRVLLQIPGTYWILNHLAVRSMDTPEYFSQHSNISRPKPENDSNINAFSLLFSGADGTYGFLCGFGDLKPRLLLLEEHPLSTLATALVTYRQGNCGLPVINTHPAIANTKI